MSLKKIAVLISGGGSNLQALIDKVHKKSAVIDIVISDEEDAYGLIRAKNNDIETKVISTKSYSSREEFCTALMEEIDKRDISLIVLAGFMKILSKDFMHHFKEKVINIHPSLIPSFCGKGYYGIKVHEKAIEYGVKLSGATVHFADEKADNGPIIIQKSVEVKSDDTPKKLQDRILKIEHEILPKAVELFCEDRIEINERMVVIKDNKGEVI